VGGVGGSVPHREHDQKHPSLNTAGLGEIRINKRFGLVYASGEKRDPEMEMEANFMDLTNLIEDVLDL